ncbi:MAG: protein kinase [Acidobacteria bacterium]|jgi:serine/threonine-protein kinase|nr:protein kinase [Acidobacteriota bacterium]
MKRENWQKVKAIFDSAVEVAPDNRSAFLNDACADDGELRREVETLLASSDEAESFMETPFAGEIAGLILDTPPNQLKNGQGFSHYKIVRQIGVGGMGEVYLAQDQKLDRQVAIKILNEKFSRHESNLERFIREAKAASALNHPNILVIHEIGENEAANYIVSEFIEGVTLREIIRESPMKLSEVLDIAIQIANALTTAHTAHIIHRDIKPENIMIRPDGFVKILDFGLAKLVEQKAVGFEASTVKQNQTAKGVILGTVNYMSPEQAKDERVDERTDIFSFGAVIYEMIAGRTPFAGDSMSETFANLINSEPPPLSRYASNVPDEMQRIIAKMLRKNKDERYQTMKGLLADLKDLRENLAFDERLEKSHSSDTENETKVLQATTGDANLQTAETNSSFARQIKQHKPLAAFTALIVLLTAIGFGVWYFTNFWANSTQIKSIAVMPFVNESSNAENEYLSDGMTETLISSLSQIPKLNVKARSSVFRYKGKDATAQAIGKELNVQAIVHGRVVQRGDDQLMLSLELVDAQTENVIWSEQYNRKQTDLVSLQSEIARDVSNKLRMKLSGADEQKLAKKYTENTEAYKLYLQGRFYLNKRTAKDIWKSIEYFGQAIAVDPNYALGYAGLADAHALLSVYRGAPPHETKPKAKEAALKALLLDDNLAEAHTALGTILHDYDYDFAGAEREFKLSIELNPNYAAAHQNYGILFSTLGRHEEALAEYRRALEIDPFSLIFNRGYGERLIYARRYDDAIAQLKKTLELDAGFVSTHYSLAVAYQMKGSYAEAIEEFAKFQELTGEPQTAASIRENYARNGWQGFLRMITEEGLQFITPWHNLATFHAELGEKDKAFAEMNKSYERRESFMVRLKVDPRLDPLRDDPRYQDLLRRVGFPQ